MLEIKPWLNLFLYFSKSDYTLFEKCIKKFGGFTLHKFSKNYRIFVIHFSKNYRIFVIHFSKNYRIFVIHFSKNYRIFVIHFSKNYRIFVILFSKKYGLIDKQPIFHLYHVDIRDLFHI